MYVKELWRYPVKSMAGEQLQAVQMTSSGIVGDRTVQVQNNKGRTVTSRTHHGLLGLKGTLDQDGNTLVDSRPWTDPTILATVQEIVGPGSRLVSDNSLDRFDVLPLLVATDGAIEEFGRDRRRLRPNIIVGGVTGLEEREWQWRQLFIGDVVIDIHDLRARCVMTTFDPDTLAFDPSVMLDIVKLFGGKLSLNCDIAKGGQIHVGQEVTISRMRTRSERTEQRD